MPPSYRMKVIFSIPTITGAIRAETMISLIETFQALWMLGIDCDIHTLSDCPDLEVARNTLAAMFREDPDATDQFWIDYDVKFPAEAVLTVLNRPEDVVAGAYRVKVDDKTEFSVVPKYDGGVPVGKVIGEQEALIEAEFVATGFLRVKRNVYDKLADAYPELRYDDNVIKTVNRPVKEAWDFFAKRIRTTDGGTRRFTTEDYAFCQRWRDIGGQVWIYPNIDFDHIGKKAYSGNFHQHLMGLPGGANHGNKAIAKAMHIEGWMSAEELIWLSAQAMCHKSIVEIGCFLGRSTRALCESTKGTVLAVDPWDGQGDVEVIVGKKLEPDVMFAEFQKNLEGCSNLTAIQLPSQEAVKQVTGPFDMVFIDGNHSYESVKADILQWMEKMTPDGLLCGHDYSYEGVRKAVEELLLGFIVVPGTDIWAYDIRTNRFERRNEPQRARLAEGDCVSVGAD